MTGVNFQVNVVKVTNQLSYTDGIYFRGKIVRRD